MFFSRFFHRPKHTSFALALLLVGLGIGGFAVQAQPLQTQDLSAAEQAYVEEVREAAKLETQYLCGNTKTPYQLSLYFLSNTGLPPLQAVLCSCDRVTVNNEELQYTPAEIRTGIPGPCLAKVMQTVFDQAKAELEEISANDEDTLALVAAVGEYMDENNTSLTLPTLIETFALPQYGKVLQYQKRVQLSQLSKTWVDATFCPKDSSEKEFGACQVENCEDCVYTGEEIVKKGIVPTQRVFCCAQHSCGEAGDRMTESECAAKEGIFEKDGVKFTEYSSCFQACDMGSSSSSSTEAVSSSSARTGVNGGGMGGDDGDIGGSSGEGSSSQDVSTSSSGKSSSSSSREFYGYCCRRSAGDNGCHYGPPAECGGFDFYLDDDTENPYNACETECALPPQSSSSQSYEPVYCCTPESAALCSVRDPAQCPEGSRFAMSPDDPAYALELCVYFCGYKVGSSSSRTSSSSVSSSSSESSVSSESVVNVENTAGGWKLVDRTSYELPLTVKADFSQATADTVYPLRYELEAPEPYEFSAARVEEQGCELLSKTSISCPQLLSDAETKTFVFTVTVASSVSATCSRETKQTTASVHAQGASSQDEPLAKAVAEIPCPPKDWRSLGALGVGNAIDLKNCCDSQSMCNVETGEQSADVEADVCAHRTYESNQPNLCDSCLKQTSCCAMVGSQVEKCSTVSSSQCVPDTEIATTSCTAERSCCPGVPNPEYPTDTSKNLPQEVAFDERTGALRCCPSPYVQKQADGAVLCCDTSDSVSASDGRCKREEEYHIDVEFLDPATNEIVSMDPQDTDEDAETPRLKNKEGPVRAEVSLANVIRGKYVSEKEVEVELVLEGVANVVELPEGFRIVGEDEPPLAGQLLTTDAHYDLSSILSAQLQDLPTNGDGWKLHLNIGYTKPTIEETLRNGPEAEARAAKIIDILERMKEQGMIADYKFGQNGLQVGKDFTVYVGDGAKAQEAARYLAQHAGDTLLPPPPEILNTVDPTLNQRLANGSDMLMNEKVAARFDPPGAEYTYGSDGIPIRKDYLADVKSGEMTLDDAIKLTDAELRTKYGDFYTKGLPKAGAPISSVPTPPILPLNDRLKIMKDNLLDELVARDIITPQERAMLKQARNVQTLSPGTQKHVTDILDKIDSKLAPPGSVPPIQPTTPPPAPTKPPAPPLNSRLTNLTDDVLEQMIKDRVISPGSADLLRQAKAGGTLSDYKLSQVESLLNKIDNAIAPPGSVPPIPPVTPPGASPPQPPKSGGDLIPTDPPLEGDLLYPSGVNRQKLLDAGFSPSEIDALDEKLLSQYGAKVDDIPANVIDDIVKAKGMSVKPLKPVITSVKPPKMPKIRVRGKVPLKPGMAGRLMQSLSQGVKALQGAAAETIIGEVIVMVVERVPGELVRLTGVYRDASPDIAKIAIDHAYMTPDKFKGGIDAQLYKKTGSNSSREKIPEGSLLTVRVPYISEAVQESESKRTGHRFSLIATPTVAGTTAKNDLGAVLNKGNAWNLVDTLKYVYSWTPQGWQDSITEQAMELGASIAGHFAKQDFNKMLQGDKVTAEKVAELIMFTFTDTQRKSNVLTSEGMGNIGQTGEGAFSFSWLDAPAEPVVVGASASPDPGWFGGGTKIIQEGMAVFRTYILKTADVRKSINTTAPQVGQEVQVTIIADTGIYPGVYASSINQTINPIALIGGLKTSYSHVQIRDLLPSIGGDMLFTKPRIVSLEFMRESGKWEKYNVKDCQQPWWFGDVRESCSCGFEKNLLKCDSRYMGYAMRVTYGFMPKSDAIYSVDLPQKAWAYLERNGAQWLIDPKFTVYSNPITMRSTLRGNIEIRAESKTVEGKANAVVTVENPTSSEQTDIVVTLPLMLPSQADLALNGDIAIEGDVTCQEANRIVTCTVARIPPAGSVKISLPLKHARNDCFRSNHLLNAEAFQESTGKKVRSSPFVSASCGATNIEVTQEPSYVHAKPGETVSVTTKVTNKNVYEVPVDGLRVQVEDAKNQYTASQQINVDSLKKDETATQVMDVKIGECKPGQITETRRFVTSVSVIGLSSPRTNETTFVVDCAGPGTKRFTSCCVKDSGTCYASPDNGVCIGGAQSFQYTTAEGADAACKEQCRAPANMPPAKDFVLCCNAKIGLCSSPGANGACVAGGESAPYNAPSFSDAYMMCKNACHP